MGKGGRGIKSRDDTDQEWTWDEVRQHSTRKDKWLVVEGKVYNITEWARKHPGGSSVISHYAGQDATEAFTSFHTNMGLVSKYMTPIRIGKVGLASDKPDEEELKSDFIQLRKTAQEMNLFKPSMFFYTMIIGHLFFFEILAYLTVYFFGTGWLPLSFSLLFNTIVQNQAGWSQHDFGHLSVFKDNRLNHAFHTFVMNVIKGASTSWWQHLHNQHHSKPNVLTKDPDVRLETLFVLGEVMPRKMAKEKRISMPYNWQQKYFFAIGPPLLFPIYFHVMTVRFLISRGHWLEFSIISLFFIRLFVLYVPFIGIFGTAMYYFALRVLESHWFVWVSQSNHIPMEIDFDKERPWVSLQLHATCNVEKSFFNDWFTGHLNFQIEHHLFPTMPRHNLYKISSHVKALCHKHHIPYKCKTLLEAFTDIVKSLKHSGEIWHSYYQTYNSP